MSPHSPWYLISLGHLTVIFFLLVPYFLDFADITLLVLLIQTLLGLFSDWILLPQPAPDILMSWFIPKFYALLSLYGRSHSCLHLHLRSTVDKLKKSLTQRLCIIKGPLDITNSISSELCVSQILLLILNSELLLS